MTVMLDLWESVWTSSATAYAIRRVERRPRILRQKMERADVEEIARLDGRQGAHIIGLQGDDN